MKPSIFAYRAPVTIADAISCLQSDPDAVVLAGGQTLLPAMNFRAANPPVLVDIQHIAALRGIDVTGDIIVVRAMTRHRELERHPDVLRLNPLIAEAMQHVAHVPIRNRGTVVGSLCHADPSAEMPLILLLLGGAVVAHGPAGQREIGAEDFFQSFLTTARAQDEIVVAAHFPVLPPGAGWAFDEVTRRHGDYAVVGVGCTTHVDGEGHASGLRLAACGIADRPVRLRAAEALLNGTPLAAADLDAAVAAAMSAVTQPDDITVSASYRRRALGALIRTTVARAAESCSYGKDAIMRAIKPAADPTSDDARVTVTLVVNGESVSRSVSVRMLLSDFLRHELGLTGTHVGCEHGVCGCCTVLIDGDAARSCLTLAVQANGYDIRTIESVANDDGTLHPIQQAFKECHGLQCGYCTPGMVMNILGRFEDATPLDLSDDGIRDVLSGNLCRCTGYINIIAAVRRAAELLGRA